MTKKEIQDKINQLAEEQFYLKMQDHWDSEDYAINRKLNNEIAELKNKLKELERKEVK